jgi:hypothetical protein
MGGAIKSPAVSVRLIGAYGIVSLVPQEGEQNALRNDCIAEEFATGAEDPRANGRFVPF